MQATNWQFLPFAGGLLDQPDWLMDDLWTLRYEYQIIKESLKK
jgi:hypothetical protein